MVLDLLEGTLNLLLVKALFEEILQILSSLALSFYFLPIFSQLSKSLLHSLFQQYFRDRVSSFFNVYVPFDKLIENLFHESLLSPSHVIVKFSFKQQVLHKFSVCDSYFLFVNFFLVLSPYSDHVLYKALDKPKT